MISPGFTELGTVKLLIHILDHIPQVLFLEGNPTVMTLLKVSEKGVLIASGAVKNNIIDVHSAF